MKDLLITGCTNYIKDDMLEKLIDDIRVVVAGKNCVHRPGRRFYRTFPGEDSFNQLFDVYSFSSVLFVSGFADGGDGYQDELRELERTLLQSIHSHVDKFILLSSEESQNYVPVIGTGGIEVDRDYCNSRSLCAGELEALCRFYASKTSLKTIVLRLPHLADASNEDNFLGSIFKQVNQKKKVLLPYRAQDRLDFISQRDLADLISRIAEEDDDVSDSFSVCSGYQHTFGDLEAILRSIDPQVKILYEKNADVINREDYPHRLRKEYGWIPKDDVMEQILDFYEKYTKGSGRSRRTLSDLAEALLNRSGRLTGYLEMVVVFILSELLHHFLGNDVYFRFVDVRLFFIVIMGTVHGIRIGVVSAILSCIALFFQYMNQGVDWTLLFYNVENWIPFMIYIMAGSVTGYVKNKKTEEIRFSQEEYTLLRDKYIFLNEVYQSTMENKGEYKKQILGFKDSFGRIFDAVQKLDNILPQGIFLEALLIMEDILENHSIAFYSVDRYEHFGRLVACSNQLQSRLPKSAVLDEIGELFRTVKAGNVYKNTNMTDGMPVYANGIFRDGKLVLFVVIYDVTSEQYGMNYMNMFRILCGLVQTAFLRALEYTELTEEQTYYPDTNVMRSNRFMELLSVQEEMKERLIAEYVLVRLDETDKQKVSNTLSRIVRTTDIIGEGSDGRLYLLLTQANRENFRFVENRLAATGLRYRVTEKVGG